MNIKNIMRFITILAFALACSGCISSGGSQVIAKKQYILHPAKSTKISKVPLENHALMINATAVTPQFAATNFVYRISESEYTRDYYNVFFIPPAQLFNQLIEQSIASSGMFSHITTNGYLIQPDYQLDSELVALYADYQNSTQPKAIIKLRMVLLVQNKSKHKVLIDKIYSSAIPLRQKNTPSLIDAWNIGVSNILNNFNKDAVSRII
jgi:ABC-type uncharacterized transport system auxiliary subunit